MSVFGFVDKDCVACDNVGWGVEVMVDDGVSRGEEWGESLGY